MATDAKSIAPSKHLVVTVHGIRTFGDWQERLGRLVNDVDPGIVVRHYKFGRFSLIAFMIPFLRWLVTRRFRKELLEITEEYRDGRIDLVGAQLRHTSHWVGVARNSFREEATNPHDYSRW
jgi:hypothetical protein